MATLLAFPILILLVILQNSIVSRITLLQGQVDLILLVVAAWGLQERARDAWFWGVLGGVLVNFISGIQFPIMVIGYLAVVIGMRLVARRIWQAPMLMMLVGTTLGTILLLGLQIVGRLLNGVFLPLGDSLSLVVLPSVLLNLLFSIPVYTMITDLARLIHPVEKEF